MGRRSAGLVNAVHKFHHLTSVRGLGQTEAALLIWPDESGVGNGKANGALLARLASALYRHEIDPQSPEWDYLEQNYSRPKVRQMLESPPKQARPQIRRAAREWAEAKAATSSKRRRRQSPEESMAYETTRLVAAVERGIALASPDHITTMGTRIIRQALAAAQVKDHE